MGKDGAAQELLVELTKSHPKHTTPLIGLADLMRSTRRSRCVAGFLSNGNGKGARKYHTNARNCERFARTETIHGGEEILQDVLARGPDDTRFLTALGHLKRRQGDCSGSLNAFQRAAALDPHNPLARIELANALRDIGQIGEAAEILTDLARSYPESPAPFISLGQLERRRGNRPAALQMFRRAASYDTQNVTLNLEIANELRELGHIVGGHRNRCRRAAAESQ